jgi:hypothetical protein
MFFPSDEDCESDDASDIIYWVIHTLVKFADATCDKIGKSNTCDQIDTM